MRIPFIAIITRALAGWLRVWIIGGILLRVTRLRDGWRPLSYVFYTTPWPVMAVGLFILTLHARRFRRAHATRRYAILTAGALFIWIALSWHSGPALSPAPALRVVAWNTGHPDKLFDQVTGWLQAQDADLIAIAESEPKDQNRLPQWQAKFPGYQIVQTGGGMICLARGQISKFEEGALGVGSVYAFYHARIRRGEYTVLQADISTLLPRLPPLQKLTSVARAHAPERLIVIGDLNTPRESRCFDEMRGFLSHSFETAGSGFAETWPTWAPALSLDHVWSSPALPPHACRIGWPMWSDHRPVLVEF